MQRGSSSSFSLSEKTIKCASHPTLSSSPLKVVRPRRKGTKCVENPKDRKRTFSNRIRGLMKKAAALCSLTDTVVALSTFFEGKFYFFAGLSTEGVISNFLPPTSPKEWVDWAEKECVSCATKEECTSLIMKYLNAVVHLLKKSKDFENSSTMQTGSSSSPSLSEKTKKRCSAVHAGSSSSLSGKPKKRPSPSTPSSSIPKIASTRRKGTDKIDDSKDCNMTFSKRCPGLTKKADALHSLTGALVAVIVVSSKDEVHSFGKAPVEEGDVNFPIISKEWRDWAEEECDSCRSKEDCVSSIMKYRVLLNCLCEKWKDLQVARVDHDISLTSPVNSAATSGESSGMDSNSVDLPMEDLEPFFQKLLGLAFHPAIRTTLDEESSCFNCEGYENDADDGTFAELQSLGDTP